MPKKITEQIKDRAKMKIIKQPVQFLSTGCTLLDLVCGKGFPKNGKIINIVGDRSSGKTLLVLDALFSMYKEYGKKLKIQYDDAESGFSFPIEKMYGSVFFKEIQKPSATVEDFMYNFEKAMLGMKKDDIMVYVLDSLDALSSDAEEKRHSEKMKDKAKKESGEKEEKLKGSYSLEKQKMLSEFFRLTSSKIKNKNILLIIISQVRQNINVTFGAKYTRTGGKSLDFYAAIIMWLAECEKIIVKDRATGIIIKARVTKNKIALPFRSGYISILFNYGIDNVATNIDFLYDLRTPQGKIKSKKSKMKFNGKEYSKNGLIRFIEANNLEQELSKKVVEKWNILEDEVSCKDRKRRW